MCKWLSVKEHEPPKDRLIEVTNGWQWVYEDTYMEKSRHRQQDQTYRTWKIRGDIHLVIWDARAFLPGQPPGIFRLAAGGVMPEFKFWREADNPFIDGDYVSARPPVPEMHEKFDGDARRQEHLAEVAKVEAQMAKYANQEWNDEMMARRQRELLQRSLDSCRERAKAAYDPPLPPKG